MASTRRWDGSRCQRKDGQQSSSSSAEPARVRPLPAVLLGRAENKPYYHFYAPAGRQHLDAGIDGRCELGYPIGDPGMLLPTAGLPVVFFYEGRRAVTMFSVSAAIRLERQRSRLARFWRSGSRTSGKNGRRLPRARPRTAQRELDHDQLRRADHLVDACKCGQLGQLRLRHHLLGQFQPRARSRSMRTPNSDGTYEYASSTWTGQTLLQQNGTPGSSPPISTVSTRESAATPSTRPTCPSGARNYAPSP